MNLFVLNHLLFQLRHRHKSIIDGVIETIEFIEKAEKKINFTDEDLKSYFLTTKEKLLIVLNNSGIESFDPKVNTSSLDDHSCEVDVVTEVTNDDLDISRSYSEDLLKMLYPIAEARLEMIIIF